MEEPRILLKYHDLTVEVESTPSRELMDHMHSTVMGQPGGFRYCHTNLAERFMFPGENYYMYLRKGGKMLGSVGFLGKPADTAGVPHDSWLIRYFSIKAPMRTVPQKRKERKDLKEENKRSSILGRFIQPVMAHPSIVRGASEEEEQGPALIYAMIEHKNLRSMNFSVQMDMETVGTLAGISFSRMRPRKSTRIQLVPRNERESMLSLLKEFYSHYTLFFHDALFKDNNYFIIRDSGRIVAGIQVYPVTWRIVDFGGRFANRLMGVLTKIRWVKKRINPEELRIMAFDGIYCEKGYEPVLYELMEGVLERTGTYVGMLMMDRDSGLYDIFKRNGKLGILNRILGSFYADIRMRFINMPEQVRQYYLDHPTYIPTHDNS